MRRRGEDRGDAPDERGFLQGEANPDLGGVEKRCDAWNGQLHTHRKYTREREKGKRKEGGGITSWPKPPL